MCDYSLMHVASRPAKVEDVVTTSGFTGTVSKGFSPVGEPDVACCVLPGTEIAFVAPVRFYDRTNAVWGTVTESNQTLARFRQVDIDRRHVHHDALEFADGQIVLLNNLVEGQQATILQLPAAPKNADEAKEQERVEIAA